MFSVFMELVKRVGIFVIIGQTILHFGISKKYEKYMKLVMSFMIGAQIVFAFGVYWKQEENTNVVNSEEYYKAWEICMEEMEKKVEEYKQNMIQSTKKQAEKEILSSRENTEVEINQINIEKIIVQ